MNSKNECEIVQDLLINYADNILNSETKKFVDEHLKSCNKCKEYLQHINEELNKDDNKEKIELDYLRKIRLKTKIKSIVIVLITIISIIFLAYFVKFIRINNLINKEEKFATESNRYVECIQTNGNTTWVRKEYHKDGKMKEINAIYTDNGEEIQFERYIFPERNEVIDIDHTGSNEAIIENGEYAKLMIKSNDYYNKTSLLSKIQKTFTYSIKKDNYLIGKDYYIIKDNYEKNSRDEYWVDIETGLTLRHISKGSEILYFPGTNIRKSINDIIEEYNYEFGIVTDDDIKYPDLTEYTIKKDSTRDNLLKDAENK